MRQTGLAGQLGRWAAAATVAAGVWVTGAREAEAQNTSSKMPVYYNGSSSSGGAWWWGDATQPWWYSNWSGTQQRPDMKDGWSGDAGADSNHGANIVHFDNNKDPTQTLNGGAWYYIYDIIFETSATARTFNKGDDGVGIKLYHGITNNVSSLQTFNVPLSVDGASTFFANSGNMTFTDPVYLNKNLTLRAGSSRTITISGVIANSGGTLSKSAHAGTVVLSGANTFSGNVSVGGSGILRISNGSALGNTTGNTTISSGGTLELTGGITVPEHITYAGVGYSSQGGVLSSSGNNTLSGLVANQTTAGSLLVSSGSSLNLSGTFSNTVSTTVGGAGNITIAKWQPKVDAPEMYKTGAGTLTLTTLTKKAARQGLVLNGGTLALTSAGTVTNLALTNATAGTTIDLSGAVKVGVMNIKASTTIKVDVATTGQSVSESLTTMNSGGWAISSDFNLKLTPGSSFNSANSATWTILTTQGSFNATDLGHVVLDTTAFAGVASSCFTKSISGKSIVVTYTRADVAQADLTLDGQASTVTKTYEGLAFSLAVGGGSGTGAISATKTGGTGTGTVGVSGNNVTLSVTACGTFIIQVTKAASTGYLEKTQTFTVTVNKGTQTISGLSDVEKTYGDGTFSLSASAVGAVTYTISPSSVATVSGSTVTIAGAGTATITANAAATALYEANSATATLTVNKKNPTVSASVSPATIRVGGTATLTGSTDSGATLTFATSASGTASLSGSGATTRTVTGEAYGTATLTVNSPATANYNAGSATCTITVKLAAPTTQPSIEATSIQAAQFGVKTTGKGDAGAVLTLVKAGSAPTTPEDGTPWTTVANSGSLAWSSAAAYPSGATDGTKVIINSTGASFPQTRTITGASANTHYYVTAYGFNHSGNLSGSNGSYAFLTPGTTIDFWTLAAEPTAAPTIGTIVEGGHGASIPVTAGTGGTGVLVLVKTGSATSVTPADGTTYAAGATLSGWTVAYSGPSGTATASGLTSLTTYQVKAFTYSLNNADAPNYYTTAFASTTFTTTDTSGPTTWATGVDGTSFLLNWSPVASDSAGYDIQTGSGTPVVLLDEGFTTGEGWLGTEGTGNKTNAKGVWTLTNPSITATSSDDTSYALFYYETSTIIQLPPLTGTVTSVTADMAVPSVNNTARGLTVEYLNGNTWTSLGNVSAVFSSSTRMTATLTFGTSLVANGLKLRLSRMNGNTVYLHHLRVNGSVATGLEGYSKQFDGLTSGTTYSAQVRKNPDGDWSDALSVKAGVVPNTPSGSAVRNAVTFSWTDAQSGAAGYIVDATTTAAGWANKSCPAQALTLNSFGSGQDWKYTGTTATSTSGTVNSAPTYSTSGDDGHFLVGRAGNAIESKPFAIAGATGLKLTFTVEAWNLANATAKIEAGRVNAYYKMDDGEWCYFGTGMPSGTADNSSAAVTLPVPKGALEGTNIAFRLVAVHAEGDGGSYLRGPYINNLKVQSTSVGAGYYGANSLSGFPRTTTSAEATAKSVKMGGLTAGQTVYFRVQALQGSTNAPTAKSVWVEATGTASAYTAPGTPGAVEGTVTRNSMTVSWTAGDTTDFSKYVLEVSTSSGFPGGSTTSYDVTGGARSKDLTGLSANTTYYFRVKAVGTDSQQSAWSSTGNATTEVYGGPTLLAADPVGRYGFTANWSADAAATGGYQIEWTRCGGSGAGDTTVTNCPNDGLTVGGDTGWRYLRPAGSENPKWTGEGASSVKGHNMRLTVASPNPNPAVASPTMDLSVYSGGYVQFSHWSRHNSHYAPDARVTLWYRTSANGSSWGAWTAGDTTADLTSSTTIVTERLPLPDGAVGSGKTYVQIKLSADHSLAEGGHGYPGHGTNSVLTGPVIKDISVHGLTAGTPDYETCGEGMSGIQNVAAGTTLKAFTGLDADTTYYYHVRSVTAGPAYSAWSEGMVTTLAAQEPPAWIHGEDIKQTQMSLEWAEADGAAGYQWELTGCGGTAWTRTALAATPTNRNLTDGDSWHYIGGGTPVAAVDGVKASEATYITAAGATYPAWADGGTTKENSLVLAGEGEPGIESEEFSTVGAHEGTLSFRFGRWYANTAELGAQYTPLTVSYSLDGGATWATWFVTENAYEYDYTRPLSGHKYGVSSNALPTALLGQPSVMLRIVAEGAGIGAVGGNNHAMGAAIAEAQLQLGGRPGNYDNGDEWTSPPSGTCTLASGTTGADGLTAHVTGLSTNTEYYFRVRSTDGTQYGAWVDGKASTLNGPATPEAPWAVDIGRHTMTIQWLAADRAETYTLEVYTNSGCTALQARITEIEGTSQTVTGLKAETTYWFKVRAHADGTDSAWSTVASAKTVDTVAVTGLRVEDILDTSMTVKWDYVAGTTYTLYWGTAATEGATDSREEVISCPAKTLERSDAGNKWFYLGGNGTYPAYWTSSGNPTNDQGHALIQDSGGKPGIQSRWFSTFGATNATVEFLHGRFNSGADSSVTVSYSIDGGVSWATAGTAPSTAATNPSVARAISLPASALGRRSVAVRLTADKASGTLGAHLKDVKVVVRTGSTGTGTPVNNASLGNTGSWTVTPGPLEPGTRYWFRLVASEAGDTAEAVTTAATRTKTTGVVRSQGFEGNSGGALDTTAWTYTTNFYTVGSKVSKSWAAGDPTVTVAKDENPLYGDRAIRLSGSSAAGVYGVVEFANFTTTAGSSLTVTVPFASRNLASGENLWLSYSTDGGTSWLAPAGTTVRTNVSGANGWLMGKIATGGSDVINQNWPYNHGSNTLTRPQGDAYVFTVENVSQLAVRIAFCGNRGSADHYYYIDEVKLTRNPGDPSGVSATAQDGGGILLGWTPPAGENQGVVILRGRDERHIPTSPIDLANLPHGYEIVTNATGGAFWPNTTSPGSCLDMNAISGWRYFYYFYGAISTDGGYMLRPTPQTANAMVKGMVDAIASMGWDGWDIHPWPYKKGRVTNPNSDSVQFIDPSQNSGKPTWETGNQYTTRYGSTNQLDVYGRTNYYGTNSFRMSGGSCVAGVNSNNPAILFGNIDLSGYKNVEFSMHFAGNVQEGGDDMHVAISTNGGTEWLQVSRTNDAGWRVVRKNTYGVVVGDSSPVNNGHWDFYFEDFVKKPYTTWDGQTGYAIPTPEGNPYWLQVPDSVTQFMARVMYYDTQGLDRYDSSYFIDEVRLFGEAALETPHPRMENIASNSFVVAWDAVPDATSYDVRVTKCAASGDDAVKLTQAFVLNVVTNGWTVGDHTSLSTTYDHTGSGYGLSLTGNGGTLTSPETGAARTLEFWSKAVSANPNSKLQVEVSADGTTWEVVTNYTAASSASATAIGTSWGKKSVALPHRQWSRVRFHMLRTGSSTAGNFYLDDIQISGGGDYDGDGCLVKEYTGLTGTSQGFTNGAAGVTLTAGTPYYVEVRANGTPGGYLTHSPWGETGDYTASDFHAAADGFEMVRMTWAASGGILVMAVPEGDDFSDVSAPTNTTAGGINGKGVVLANTTSSKTGAGFEHVRPYGARVEDYEAKYVVYWKHGSYWEGRLETNVVLGTYVAQVADSMSYTNGIAMDADGVLAKFNTGKGWSNAWEVITRPTGNWAGQVVRPNTRPYGLMETNQLWGAGGNQMVLYPTNWDGGYNATVQRQLASPLKADQEWWGMFTMKVTYSGGNKWAGMQLLDSGKNNKASIGKLWSQGSGDNWGKLLGIEGSSTAASSYVLNNGGQCVIVFKWDPSTGKMYLHPVWYENTNNPVFPTTAGAPEFNAADDTSVSLSMSDIHYIRLVAQNGSASDYLFPVYFDEIRLGSSWEELVGKQTEPPQNVATAQAWTDGNELVRIAWQYAGGLTNAGVVHPLADGVKIYAKEGTGEGEWFEIYKGKGTNTVVAKDAWSRWDHVVAPGSTHEYKVVAYASSKYTNGVVAVNRDAAPSTEVTMGLYGEKEYLNPFSYTNNVGWTTATWYGGNGFSNNWWHVPDGAWTNVNPETAQAALHITNAVPGSRLPAGNVLMASVTNGATASINRTLGGNPWCGTAGETFYVAFRMGYQWSGRGKEAGLRLTDAGGSHIQIGKGYANEDTESGRKYWSVFGVTATPFAGGDESTGWMETSPGNPVQGSMSPFGGTGQATNAYLVVAKVYWLAKDGDNSGKVSVKAWKYQIGVDSLPGEEPSGDGDAQYDNARLGAISKIELIAGCRGDSGNTIGTAYFDEIRFGTSWEDIVGATEPEDVWTAGITNGAYKGDFATWTITSKPHGPKQSAWVAISSNDTTFANSSVESNSTTWLDKVYDTDHWNSVWQGKELQFKGAGTWYGGGVVKGELVTVKSWERAVNEFKWNIYNVTNLPNPTKTNDVNNPPEVFTGDAKLGLAWAPATVGGRTFPEVMIVRFPNGADAWSPTDGNVYLKGGSAGGGTVVYRGTNSTSLVDKGLNTNSTYRYQFYTVNNSYYSPGVSVTGTTSTNAPPIEINGDPNDWIGEPSEVKNSSKLSPNGEWIWTDKVGDGRKDNNGAYDADITEFRIKVDATNVYFMARLNCLTNPANPYIAVGIATNVDATRLAPAGNEDGENWLGDEANTFMGGNLFSPASLHYADIQMTVHQVGGTWQIELFKKGGSSWYGPGGVGDVTWQVASSEAGAEDPCVEWKLKRSDLGLDFGSVTPARFTVASFVNSGGWNNDVVGTTKLSDGTSYAVDTLAIAPWGVNDKDLSLTAWDEGIKNNNAEYWFDIWFGPGALHNAAPTDAALSYPPNNATNIPASPTMTWTASTDGPSDESSYRGFVVGYLVEVSTNAYFNGLEGTMENGPISCRVNIPGATNTSYRYLTDSRYYWWRVRARDNSGALSSPTVWHYAVQGKTDNEGPEPKLLYVGTNVMMFVTNEAYRTEQIISGDATSVLDSELEDGGHTFGFVIEWYDVNGVYATNHMHDQLGSPSSGGFAFNILAEHSDGIPYGRVSPNWDLVIVDRALTNGAVTPDPEKVGTNTYTWTFATNGLVLPTDDGGTETVTNWYIDCGLDKVFNNSETKNDGNFGQYLTNFVTGAFSIGNYRTSLDIYLTVSAEDGCETGEYGPTQWITPPVYSTNGSAGSYAPGPQAGAHGSVLSSGWCADFPNPSRNVTTNRLLHIHVRDNDVIPPTSSTAKWGDDALAENGEKLLPSVVVSTGTPGSGAWDPTWARLGTNGLTRLPTHDGQGKTLQWHLTDADVVANGGTWKGSGNKLNFFFNVYDEYLHSGMQVATNHAAGLDYIKTITPTLKRTNWMDNTGMILGSSGSAWTNWAGYAIGISTNKRQGDDSRHGLGTDPDTVLAWTYDAAQTNLEALLGTANPLEAIGPDGSGEQPVVTNALKLFAWDSDNNAAGDQEGAEIAFGQLVFSDDDATRPIIPAQNDALGTGTNYVRYGSLAGWTFSGNSSSVTVKTNSAEMMHGMTATRVWGGTNGAALPDVTSGTKANGVYWANNRLTMSHVKGKGRYYEFDLAGLNETRWTADTLVFNSYVSATGPETLELTWLSPGSEEESQALSDGELTAGWSTNGACLVQTVSGFDRFKMASSAGSGTLTRSTPISTAGKVHARVDFRVGAFGDAGPEADTGPSLTVTVKRNGSATVSTLGPIKLTDFEATAAAENYRNWLEYNIELPTNAVGSADTYTIEWAASGVNGSKGFLLRDVGYRTEGAFASETTLATMTVPKSLDENKDAEASNPYMSYTETTVTMMWPGTEVGDNETRRFRLYAYGGDQVAVGGTWGIKDMSIHGIASAPKGHEITDRDMREGNWSMALEVSDDTPSGYDTVQSGLWIEGDGGSYTQYVPRYKLLYPAAYAGHSGETVVTADYPAGGITPAVYTYTADGDFTNVPCQWGLTGEAAPTAHDHAHDGNKVLLLPSNGVVSAACRTNVLSTAGLVGSVSGATVSGSLCLRSLSTAEGVDNAVTLTLEMLDSSSSVLATRVLNLAADRQVGWREVVLPQWPVDSKDVAKLKITIAQANATGAEVYVDGVDIRTALWGGESEDVENGKVLGARFSLAGNALGRKTMPLSDSPEMSGSGSHEYALVSTVYDYDHDREGDALGVSSTNTFSLYDNDEEAPALGKRFGGSLSARLGSAANSKHTESGTNVTVHVTDKDMAEAYGADHEARMDLDIDAYDFSGWGVTAIDLQYGGASSRLYTEGAGDNFLTFAKTNDAARYDQPSATNTLGASVLSWWNRTGDVRAEFAKTNSEALQPMPVRAFISDWDDDRVGDSMVLRDTEELGKQVGMLYFLDSDFNAPAYKPYYTNIEHFFVGTNDVATTFEKIVKGGAPWGSAEKSMRELRRTDGTGLATNTLIYTNQVYTIYDSELRTNSNFYIMANLGDRSGGISGQSIAGIRQGTTATTPWTDAFGTAFAITNTTASIYRGGSLVTNLASHWSTNYSSSQRTTRSIGGAAVQTWLYPVGMARDEVGLLLPPGEVSNDLLVKFDVWDADFDRPGDQMHSELTGPALRVRDNDTVRPNNPTEVQVNGDDVTGSVTRETAAWTNSLANWNVSFVAATDGTAVEPDLLATGVDEVNGYRMVAKTAGLDTASDGNWWLPLTNVVAMTTSEDGDRRRAGLTSEQQAKVVQGLTTQLVFAVDRDDDRPGDSLASLGVEVPLAYDITPPPKIGTASNQRLVADPDHTDDPTTQFDLWWPTKVGDSGDIQLGPDDTGHDNHPAKGDKTKYDYLSPWATYKVYYTNYEESAIASDDSPTSETKSWVYTNFITTAKYLTWTSVTATATAVDPTAPTNSYASLGVVTNNMTNGWQKVRLYDLDFDQHYIVIIVGVDKAGNEGPAGLWSWATNNTIKFALTQAVVRAVSEINEALPTDPADIGMRRIATDEVSGRGVQLYWMAAGMKDGVGAVNKYYDLIYRDARSFNETGSEQWQMATSVFGTGTNSGTSKTNWNYQVDSRDANSITNLSRKKLRFYRASYTGRWNPPSGARPLASEEVYSMDRVPLLKGRNFVGLQGMPWTNTLGGLFGTNWPTSSETAESVGVEIYPPGVRESTGSTNKYWLLNGKWSDGKTTNDWTHKELDELGASFYGQGFAITLPPQTTTNAHFASFTNYQGTNALWGMWWYPILQVPTNGLVPANPQAEGLYQRVEREGVVTNEPTADTTVEAGKTYYKDAGGETVADTSPVFSVEVAYGDSPRVGGERYTLVSLNLPVAVNVKDLRLLECGFQSGDGHSKGDVIYTYDNERKTVRGNSMIYHDGTAWRNANGSDMMFYPNDAILILSLGHPEGKEPGQTWTWTYRPSDFYKLPTRWMGQ